MMTVSENIAYHFPLHYQRIVELTHAKELLSHPSDGCRTDLFCLFIWHDTEEGHDYWEAFVTGKGLQ